MTTEQTIPIQQKKYKIGDKVVIYSLFEGVVKKVESNNLLVSLKRGVLMNCHPKYTKMLDDE